MPQETDEPLQPVVEATPAACRMVRRALDNGVAAFEKWGIETPPGSWIQDAASWLDEVVARDSLGANDEELKRTSAAISLAVDLYHIGTCLGEEANRQVAAELASIHHGRLLGRGDSAAGKDYLTQFWVGALLAQSKLTPRIVAYDREDQAKPDFVFTKGGVDFAVEVKRPRTRHSAKRAVLAAAGQLRTLNGPGIIIVDATECMSVDPWGVSRAAARTRDQVRSEIGALHEELQATVKTYSRSGKCRQISMLMTLIRYWNWAVDESGSAQRDAGLRFHAAGFRYLWSNQITGLTRGIQEALLGGVKQLTGNPPIYSWV